MVPFAALCVRLPLVKTARDEDVRRQRAVFLPHFLDGCIHFAHSVAECREGILQTIGAISEAWPKDFQTSPKLRFALPEEGW